MLRFSNSCIVLHLNHCILHHWKSARPRKEASTDCPRTPYWPSLDSADVFPLAVRISGRYALVGSRTSTKTVWWFISSVTMHSRRASEREALGFRVQHLNLEGGGIGKSLCAISVQSQPSPVTSAEWVEIFSIK